MTGGDHDRIGQRLSPRAVPLQTQPLAPISKLKYKDSKLVGYEEPGNERQGEKALAKKIAEGKLAPEAFDKLSLKLPSVLSSDRKRPRRILAALQNG